jgi:hypothetical protein
MKLNEKKFGLNFKSSFSFKEEETNKNESFAE